MKGIVVRTNYGCSPAKISAHLSRAAFFGSKDLLDGGYLYIGFFKPLLSVRHPRQRHFDFA
jgi:hypothetical protein